MGAVTREQLFGNTLLPALVPEDQDFLRGITRRYDLGFHEVRRLAQVARDLEMWRERPLATWWQEAEAELSGDWRERKEALLEQLERHMDQLRSCDKAYPTPPLRGLTRTKAVLSERPSPAPVFGLCPFYSKEANCCGLYTIDAASGCALGCTYCPVSAFLGEKVEFSVDLAARLAEVELDPECFYHVSTGQFSDSLVWGDRHGILKALIDFARRQPNVLLELKTKSDRIDFLLRQKLPENLLCSWILNTETIIRNEEHGTASLARRLQAARQMAEKGCRIAFHLHPLIRYEDYRTEYASLAGRLMADFSPEEIDFLSLGVISFTQPVVREIRRRGGESKALQMPLVADPLGKLTYPAEQRIDLYSCFYRALQPWHGRLFVYLCMETTPVWDAVLGGTVTVRRELERVFRGRRRSTRGSPSNLTSAA